MLDFNNDIGDPIQSLEIDSKEPAYQVYDYGIDGVLIERRSLDVSFGSRKMSISVTRKSFRNK